MWGQFGLFRQEQFQAPLKSAALLAAFPLHFKYLAQGMSQTADDDRTKNVFDSEVCKSGKLAVWGSNEIRVLSNEKRVRFSSLHKRQTGSVRIERKACSI
jgi:hypothetical protein